MRTPWTITLESAIRTASRERAERTDNRTAVARSACRQTGDRRITIRTQSACRKAPMTQAIGASDPTRSYPQDHIKLAGRRARSQRPSAGRRPLRRGRAAGLVAALVVVIMMAVSTSASAGVMQYGTCNDSGQTTSASGWRGESLGNAPSGTSFGSVTNTCGANGGVLAATVGRDATTMANVGIAWTFTAPAATRISAVNLAMYSYSTWAGPSAYLVRAWKDGSGAAPNVIWGPVPDPGRPHAYQGYFAQGNLDWESMTWAVTCTGALGPHCDAAPWQQWMLYGGVIDLTDNHAPNVSSVSGSLPSSGTISGTKTVSYNVTDQGVGAYQTLVYVDGQLKQSQIVDDNGGKCRPLVAGQYRFGYHVPCKLTTSDTVSIDTRDLRDGTHAVRVLAVDAAGNRTVVADRDLTTDNKPVVTARPALTVQGRPGVEIGATLVASRGTWDRSPTSYTYAWERCRPGGACETIAGATAATYDVQAADAYKELRVTVRASNAAGTSEPSSSDRSAIVPDTDGVTDPIPAARAAPRWEVGTNVTEPRPGEVLTIDPGAWTGPAVTLTFRFKRCSSAGVCVTVADGSARTYTLTAADVDSTIVGEVTGTNAHGSRTAQTTATGAVLPTERSTGRGPTPKPIEDPPPVPTLPDVVVPGPSTGGGKQVIAVPNGACEGGAARLAARFGKTSKTTVKWGKGAALKLTLVCLRTGKPISGAELTVATSQLGATKAKAGVVKTAANGVATLKLPKGASRSLAIGWRSDSLARGYAAQTSATLLVRSKVTLKVGPRKVRERGKIRFKGAIVGAPKGILVNVQALDGKRWRTFDQVKTAKKGAVRYDYTFSPRSRAGATFTFRIVPVAGQKKLATVPVASPQAKVRLVG